MMFALAARLTKNTVNAIVPASATNTYAHNRHQPTSSEPLPPNARWAKMYSDPADAERRAKTLRLSATAPIVTAPNTYASQPASPACAYMSGMISTGVIVGPIIAIDCASTSQKLRQSARSSELMVTSRSASRFFGIPAVGGRRGTLHRWLCRYTPPPPRRNSRW